VVIPPLGWDPDRWPADQAALVSAAWCLPRPPWAGARLVGLLGDPHLGEVAVAAATACL